MACSKSTIASERKAIKHFFELDRERIQERRYGRNIKGPKNTAYHFEIKLSIPNQFLLTP